jgi:hypothetical protein
VTLYYYYKVQQGSNKESDCLSQPGNQVFFASGLNWLRDNNGNQTNNVCRSEVKITDDDFEYITYAPALGIGN